MDGLSEKIDIRHYNPDLRLSMHTLRNESPNTIRDRTSNPNLPIESCPDHRTSLLHTRAKENSITACTPILALSTFLQWYTLFYSSL